MMPAPGIYAGGYVDPFRDDNPISRDLPPEILYATDRAPAEPGDDRFRYFSYQRAKKLHLGAADVSLGYDQGMTWQEARQISLLKNRTDDFPLRVDAVRDFGVLAETIAPGDDQTERSPAPGRRFMQAIDRRLVDSGNRNVFIYVHGYKVNFENPILVAAELWHFLGYQGAFIAYSWPTKASTLAYVADLDSAVNSARYLRTLVLAIAANTRAERIHIIGYSAGTRLVGRMLADLGMYGYSMDPGEIREKVRLGNVILTGSDVDTDILAGYLQDGALRIPTALTLYVSRKDSALEFSRRVFRGRERAGELLERRPLNQREQEFFDTHPQLRIIDVTEAEGSTGGNGHRYFRTSPWVSSDLLMTLLYDLPPEERGLVRETEGWPVWDFPPDYLQRLVQSLQDVNPALTGR